MSIANEGNKLMHEFGDEPIQKDYAESMKAIMTVLDDMMNGGLKGKDRKVGIVVLTFPFGDGDGRCNFMSNGVNRKDLVILMKEMIARFEGQPEMKGSA